MEEQKSYMQQLDDWSNEFVVGPTWDASKDKQRDPEGTERVLSEVRKAIREKVLQSYRNGQAAGPYKRVSRPQKQTQR